jgi:hypothetical protein
MKRTPARAVAGVLVYQLRFRAESLVVVEVQIVDRRSVFAQRRTIFRVDLA